MCLWCCSKPYRSTADEISEGVDLSAQTIILTGPTAGIGLETAKTLLKRKVGRLVMAARDEKKCQAVAEALKKETGNNNITTMVLDTCSLKSVRAFVAKYKESGFPIHSLICNAGAFGQPYKKTEDGFESMCAASYYGHFLMINMLLDVLDKSGPCRVVLVSSSLHKMPNEAIDFNAMPCPAPEKFNTGKQYQQAKLMQVLFAKEFASRHKDKKISIFTLHPGVIPTHFSCAEMGCCFCCVFATCYCILKSPQQGAATTVYCATAKGLETKSGNYFTSCHDADASECGAQGKDMKVAAKLWETTEKLVGGFGAQASEEKKSA
jgi:NAD(P)-dependent dehydrogenase (short-subunit alcohol dehydrogenase family)